MTDTTTPVEPGPAAGETPPVRTTTIVFITADGVPDAGGNGSDIAAHITGYNRPTAATSVGPVAEASPGGALRSDPYAGMDISRNAPCPCGSGNKYKHCHGSLA